MSKIEVDAVEPQSGTSLTLGASGDTITIPAGATFDSSAATQVTGGYIIIDPIIVTSTDTFALTSSSVAVSPSSASNCIVSLNGVIQAPTSSYTISGSDIVFVSALTGGSDVIDFITVLGTPLSIGTPSDGTVTPAKLSGVTEGIKEADQWRLTATKTDATDITANLERNDTNFSVIGSGMSESSGIFTFPQTGIYLITAQGRWISNGSASLYMGLLIKMTTDNSSYVNVATVYDSASTNAYANTYINSIVDITNTSTHKLKFTRDAAGTQSQLQGDTDANLTAFTFIRLGDT